MGGLTRYKDGRFTIFTEKDGLETTHIRTIVEDHEGALWFGTSRGLSRYKDGKFSNYSFPHPSETGPSGVNCIYEDAEHVIWFGTMGSGLGRLKNGKLAAYGTKPNDMFSIFIDTVDATGTSVRGMRKRVVAEFAIFIAAQSA